MYHTIGAAPVNVPVGYRYVHACVQVMPVAMCNRYTSCSMRWRQSAQGYIYGPGGPHNRLSPGARASPGPACRWGHWNRWQQDYYWYGSMLSEAVSEQARLMNVRLLERTSDACPFGYGCGLEPELQPVPELQPDDGQDGDG